jgi:hypothetical protein
MSDHLRAVSIAAGAVLALAAVSLVLVLTTAGGGEREGPRDFFDEEPDFDEGFGNLLSDERYIVTAEPGVQATSRPALQVSVAEGPIPDGRPLSMAVVITDAPPLAGYEFDIFYDGSLLTPTGIQSTDLAVNALGDCSTSFDDGRIAARCSPAGPESCPRTAETSDIGILMTLDFRPERAGETVLTFENVRFHSCLDGRQEEVLVEAIGSTVTVQLAD